MSSYIAAPWILWDIKLHTKPHIKPYEIPFESHGEPIDLDHPGDPCRRTRSVRLFHQASTIWVVAPDGVRTMCFGRIFWGEIRDMVGEKHGPAWETLSERGFVQWGYPMDGLFHGKSI